MKFLQQFYIPLNHAKIRNAKIKLLQRTLQYNMTHDRNIKTLQKQIYSGNRKNKDGTKISSLQ